MKRRDLAKRGVAVGAAFAMSVAGAMSACAARQAPEAPADVVLINGKVFPADGGGVLYEALAIRGNTIAAGEPDRRQCGRGALGGSWRARERRRG